MIFNSHILRNQHVYIFVCIYARVSVQQTFNVCKLHLFWKQIRVSVKIKPFSFWKPWEKAAFHQDLHSLVRLKQSSGTEIYII